MASLLSEYHNNIENASKLKVASELAKVISDAWCLEISRQAEEPDTRIRSPLASVSQPWWMVR